MRLHDMGLVGVELRPIDRVLVLQFEYTEARWTPAAAVPTPVVVMRFEGVAIREWEHDGATYGGDEPPGEAYGQVEDFEYDDRGDFQADDLRVPHRVHCVAADHHIYTPPMIIRVGTPRVGSFAAFRQGMLGRCSPWRASLWPRRRS